MGFVDAMVAEAKQDDSVFVWAAEFGDTRMMRALADKYPERMVKAIVGTSQFQLMQDMVRVCAIGLEESQALLLKIGSIRDLVSWFKTPGADAAALRKRLGEIAVNNIKAGSAEIVMVEFYCPCLPLEESIIETGDTEAIEYIARYATCRLARELMKKIRGISEVMEG